ncbi:hypothetical protein C7212DRAFT_209055 [Tuber magnatum]|uniref:Zn(2)-C6 fungal-type domain-containing protein n=1 Tax=Tuber magnatum TaxID=42249 RepID=A0A317SMJ9_9PEZI|nr:hypothetical protein C7212DRAFT_209055 [Tuber magnatum]
MESQLPQGYSAAGGADETGSSDQQQQPQQSGNGNSSPETTDATSSSSAVQNAAVSPSEGGDGGNSGAAPSSAAAVAKASRKRTKTGCLTCRKRRIKCGEERPTCANCIKSKRVCEGYNQRVVFKDGMNGIKPPHLRHIYQEHQHTQQQHGQMFHCLGQQSPVTPPGDALGHHGQYQQQQDPYNQPQQVPVAQGHDPGAQQYIPYYSQVPNSAASTTFPESPTSSNRPQFNTPADAESAPSIFRSPGPSSNPATITAIVEPIFSGTHFVGPEFIQLHQAPAELELEYDDDGDEMWDEDDDDVDDYEVHDLDEMMMGPTGQEMISPRAHISNVIEPHSRHLANTRISFRSFLPDQGVLTTYHPTMTSSPLMNQTTAQIFCHFIYVLGPSLSLFERHPPNPHVAFTPGAGLNGPQNVWSYTVPMLSLSHPPLLHAILALSSLHISKLTHGPTHPSLLHYHIALRRLGKAIASDKHRGHAATLTATLVLGYYETMAAEHDKWSSHIHGAKQLLKEIDFDRLNRRVSMMEEERADGGQGSYGPASQPSLLRLRKMRRQPVANEADENLTAYIMGKTKRRPHGSAKKPDAPFSRKEEEIMQLQEDMFWWFAKMDCYQSVLSGCPLVLDYVFWSKCPPRARIGTLGTTYGSSDHFYLLLGRLCDFQVRDLKRKKAMQKANGGMWVPPPEMGGPPRGMGRGRGMGPSLDQMHFGMIPPPTGPPRLPTAFTENLPRNPNKPAAAPRDDPQLEEDLEAATVLAETEWAEIYKAFHVFQESLGHEYQPLPIEYMPVQNTPFGAAIYFRTYSIATLQSLYNMALIILHRCHPSMPAVSMVAAGVAAQKTAKLAIDIARITAGLVPTDPTGQINPALGASLIESSMPIFFAAVQYQDQAQREWVVMKLREIARLTGWATASRVLLGCQRAWEKAAEMGRGPAYTRPPFEEEGELFYEAFNVRMAADTGINSMQDEEGSEEAGSKRFLWRTAGRKTAGAAGILGEEGEDLGISGLNLNMGV